MVGYRQTNQKTDTGKTLTRWPVFVDHFISNQSGQRSGIENSEFRFEYYTGSLECSFTSQDDSGRLHTRGIREHVCEILEGGIQAFKERERKYGL